MNSRNKSLLELTHFVRSELGSVLSEHDDEELSWGPESDLLECISVSKGNGVTKFTPSDGLEMLRFRFRHLGFRFGCLGLWFHTNIGCMKELWFTIKTRMEKLVSRCGTGAYPCPF